MTDLKARFQNAVTPEPPFATGLGAALDDVTRAGRRRRARAMAGKGVAVAAVLAIAGGALYAVLPGGHPTGAPVAAGGSSTAHPSDSAVAEVDPLDDPATLTRLARGIVASDVAGIRPGDAITVHDDDPTVHVNTPEGRYDITVYVADGVTTVVPADGAGCIPSTVDGKPCTLVAKSANDVAESFRFSDGSGRVDLTYVARAGTPSLPDRTLVVQVSNYTQKASGEKVVGPAWQDAGITVKRIRDVLAEGGGVSGLPGTS